VLSSNQPINKEFLVKNPKKKSLWTKKLFI
jgi:hypothetical protein